MSYKVRKTSQHLINESRKNLPKVAPEGITFNKKLKVKYDKDYGVDRILYGDMKITTEHVKTVTENGKSKKVKYEQIIYTGKRVTTTNAKYEIDKAHTRYVKELKNKNPGTIYISNCKDSGKARILDKYR